MQEMATHSHILVWEIPWTEEPGGLQSVGSQRVGPTLPVPFSTDCGVMDKCFGLPVSKTRIMWDSKGSLRKEKL